MYRLRFVYSDGTDDFDYWDEIETFEKDFTDAAGLVSRFIKLVQDHPQIESYEIRGFQLCKVSKHLSLHYVPC